jgi:hypothetical protein
LKFSAFLAGTPDKVVQIATAKRHESNFCTIQDRPVSGPLPGPLIAKALDRLLADVTVQPYLRIKTEQAKVAIKFQNRVDTNSLLLMPLNDQERSIRKRFYTKLVRLKNLHKPPAGFRGNDLDAPSDED